MSAERTARIIGPWGARTPYPVGGAWPVRVDTHLADGITEARRGSVNSTGACGSKGVSGPITPGLGTVNLTV